MYSRVLCEHVLCTALGTPRFPGRTPFCSWACTNTLRPWAGVLHCCQASREPVFSFLGSLFKPTDHLGTEMSPFLLILNFFLYWISAGWSPVLLESRWGVVLLGCKKGLVFLGCQLGFWRCSFHSCLCCTILSKWSAVRFFKHPAFTSKARSSKRAALANASWWRDRIFNFLTFFCQPEYCFVSTVWLSAFCFLSG